MSDIVDLYRRLSDPTGASVSEATSALMELYSDPNTISALIDVFPSVSEEILREHIAIGIRKILQVHWGDMKDDQFGETVKASLLHLLTNESVAKIRDRIIDSFDVILYNKTIPWPELFEFADTLLVSQDPSQLEVALRIYGVAAPNRDQNELIGGLGQMCDLINSSFQTGNDELSVAATHLLYVLSKVFEPPVPNELEESFNNLLQVLHAAFTVGSAYTYKIADELANTISETNIFDNQVILETLLQIATDDEVSEELLYLVFNPLEALVRTNFAQIRERITEIVEAVFHASDRLFIDDCAIEQSNAYFVLLLLTDLSQQNSANTIYEEITHLLSDDSEGLTFASIETINAFILNSPETAACHIPNFLEILINHIDPSEIHHGVAEASLSTLASLIKVVNAGVSEYTSNIAEACLSALQSDHEPLAIAGARAIRELITCVPISDEIAAALLEALSGILQGSEEAMEAGVECLAPLVFALGPSAAQYAEQIYGVFAEAASVDASEGNVRIKAAGLLGLSVMHRVLPAQVSSAVERTAQILAECAQSGNPLLAGAALGAFANLIGGGTETDNGELLEIGIQTAVTVLETDYPARIEEDEETGEEHREIAESKCDALDFVRAAAKAKLEIIGTYLEQLIPFLISAAQPEFDENVSIRSIKALAQIIINFDIEIEQILGDLGELTESQFPGTVSSVFKALNTFIKSGKETDPALVQRIIGAAAGAFLGKIPCVDPESDPDDELLESAARLMKTVAPTSFYMKGTMFGILRALRRQERMIELSYAIDAVVPFLIFSENISPEEKLAQAQIIFGIAEECDGYMRPSALLGAAALVQSDEIYNDLAAESFEAVAGALLMEDENQPMLGETRAAAAAYLISAARRGIGTLDELIEGIVNALPITNAEAAAIVYPELCAMFESAPEQFESVLNELLGGLAQLLGRTQPDFDSLKLSQETVVAAINTCKKINSATTQAMAVAREILGSDDAFERFTKRIE